MRVERYDLNAPISKVTQTPSGGIRVDGAVTRSGVFVYALGDGTRRREYRPPEDVFAEDSLASLRGAPVTVMHPAEPVSRATWKRDAVGHLGDDVKIDGGRYVVAGVLVQDAAAVASVNARELIELSCGYSCGLEMTPGTTPEGEPYDAIQRGILYNHVALLPKGDARGGPEIRLRLDAGRCIVPSDTPEEEKPMAEKTDTTKDDEIKALRDRADAAEKKARDLEASIPKRVAERGAILAKAIGWGVVKSDEAGAPAGDDDTIIRGILAKAKGYPKAALDLMTHEVLMALLVDVAGAAPADAPAEGDKPPSDGAPPPAAPPGAGGMPADSIHTARDASDGKPPRNEDAELAARRDAAEKKRREAWKTPRA